MKPPGTGAPFRGEVYRRHAPLRAPQLVELPDRTDRVDDHGRRPRLVGLTNSVGEPGPRAPLVSLTPKLLKLPPIKRAARETPQLRAGTHNRCVHVSSEPLRERRLSGAELAG